MGETTKIEWADATVNPWWGCTKVSPACASCYADTFARRWGKRLWGPGAPREDHRAGARKLAMRLQRQAVAEGRRLRVFCASMADWLDPEVPAEWLADLLALVDATPALDWLLLTKRPHLWRERLQAVTAGHAAGNAFAALWLAGAAPPNVWVGATVEDQQRADERVPALLAIPARVRFLSCEPLLGPLELTRAGAMMAHRAHQLVHWIIGGGESGRGARPTHPDWARGLRDDAVEFGVPFFWKQNGEWLPVCPVHPEPGVDVDEEGCDLDPGALLDGYDERNVRAVDLRGAVWDERDGQPPPGSWWTVRVGKAKAGRLLDGRTWDEVPEGRA